MTTPGNGGPPQGPSAQQGQAQPGQAQLGVLGQYIKDFSFENPNAPRSLQPTQTQPAINIQINVSVQRMAETDYEVTLTLEGKAENSGTVLFAFDFMFTGNHDEVVAEALGLNTTLESLLQMPGSRVINYEPSLMLSLEESCRLQCRLNIETRTNAYQIRTGQFQSSGTVTPAAFVTSICSELTWLGSSCSSNPTTTAA